MPPARSQPPGCFWVVFLLMGLIGTVFFVGFLIVPAVRANLFYEETTCTVLNSRLAHDNEGNFRPEIHIEYHVAGQAYQVWTYDATGVYSNIESRKAILDQFAVGRQYPCWYDPAAPEKSVLVRGLDVWCLMVLIPVMFAVIGTCGLLAHRRARQAGAEAPWTLPRGAARPLIGMGCALLAGFGVAAAAAFALFFTLAARNAPFWLIGLGFFAPFIPFVVLFPFLGRRLTARLARALPSKERQAVAETRSPSPPPRDEGTVVPEPAPDDLPTVPDLKPAGAGEVLAAALAREPTGTCALGCLIPFAAVWIGGICYFGQSIWDGHQPGRADWFQTAFYSPFVLVAVGLVVAILVLSARGLVSLLAGRVRAEVSAFPLRPGGRYVVCVRRRGGVPLSGVALALVCRESATYTAGTSTTTATREVLRVEADPPEGDPSDGPRTSLAVPRSAMHSFASGHNKVEWLIEVRGRVLGLLPWRGLFPVLVHPAAAED